MVKAASVVNITSSNKDTLFDNVWGIFYSVNIQQIAELSSETYDAVTSVVAMAPGTVTVVQQVKASLTKDTVRGYSKTLKLICG